MAWSLAGGGRYYTDVLYYSIKNEAFRDQCCPFLAKVKKEKAVKSVKSQGKVLSSLVLFTCVFCKLFALKDLEGRYSIQLS